MLGSGKAEGDGGDATVVAAQNRDGVVAGFQLGGDVHLQGLLPFVAAADFLAVDPDGAMIVCRGEELDLGRDFLEVDVGARPDLLVGGIILLRPDPGGFGVERGRSENRSQVGCSEQGVSEHG